MTDTEIAGLTLDRRDDGGWRATGVRATAADPGVIRARREVVLAAGSIGSPAILQRSGVGRGDTLIAAGIPLRHELSGVGENLQDHLQVRTIYQVANTVTLNRRARTLFGRVAMGIEYFLRHTGPLTMPPSQLGAFARSDPSLPAANLEWHVQPLSLDRFGAPLHKFDAITPSVCNLKPTSRGHVRIRTPDPAMAPAITLNYLSTDSDCAIAVKGLKMTREIMAAAPLARFTPQELKPGTATQTDEALLEAARGLGTTIFHPVGTCRMGNDALAVVDDRLRVHGIEGLRVIDASIMPEITAGNTNAPTVMIAEKGAEFIRQAS
jgi:choline dehydrogenase